MSTLGPRIVVAATHSGSGKTTVATGLIAALTARGTKVAPAKVGPDFIDPGYHALAAGRPGRNLDEWICGSEAIAPLAARASSDCDLLVVEGVMGLFDGAYEPPEASTASVASLLEAPVLLTLDASSIGSSIAALARGFIDAAREKGVVVAGLVLNKVGSDSHEELLRRSLDPLGLPVIGALRRDDRLVWRDRHLGLVPVAEHAREVSRSIEVLASVIAQSVDLEAVLAIARTAPVRRTPSRPEVRPVGRAVVAVAGGAAFSFVYEDNLERLREAGAEIAFFDPRRDIALPEGAAALYAGGGFPESYAEELSSNTPLAASVRDAAASGMGVWAECGGMAWLARSLNGHPMCGVVPTHVTMGRRLFLGYRHASFNAPSPIANSGALLRGHEFHYSSADPAGDALHLAGSGGSHKGGFASDRLIASYLHLHLGWDPFPAANFVASAIRHLSAVQATR